jgi:HPt (histidine-containing phosphotransfer) domain-containing protein
VTGAAPAVRNGAAVLDHMRWQMLVSLTAGRREALHQMVQVFLEDAPRRIEVIRTQGADAAERAAHTLRGGAGSLGVAALSQLCGAIEERLRAGTPAVPLIEALPVALDDARAALLAALEDVR